MFPLISAAFRVCGLLAIATSGFGRDFTNFETAPTHSVDLSPDGHTLGVCHLAANRLLLFDVSTGLAVASGSIRVGHDPTAVRFHTVTEAWVVNNISSNLNVVDVVTGQTLAVIPT